MENVDKNASSNSQCPHFRTLETRHVVNREVVTVRRCTHCREIVPAYRTRCAIQFPAPSANWERIANIPAPAADTESAPSLAVEDMQAPAYWDCSPDLRDKNGIETFRTLGWSIALFAIFLAIITLRAVAEPI